MIDDDLSDMCRCQNPKEKQGDVGICHWSPEKFPTATVC